MKIEVQTIIISDGHNYYGRYDKGSLDHEIVSKSQVELVAGKGIVGDRFFDYKEDYKGQITFFSDSTIDEVKEELGYSHAEAKLFRRNVVLGGIQTESLVGKRFRIEGTEFTGSCEAAPCFWMDEAVGEGTHEFLKGRGGLRARITKGGILSLGEHTLEILGDLETDTKEAPVSE